MPFLLLLVVTVACLPIQWPAPPDWVVTFGQWLSLRIPLSDGVDARGASVLTTWVGVALMVAAAVAVAQWTRWQVHRHPARRDDWSSRHGTFRFYHLITLLAFFGLALYVLGWGWVAQGAGTNPDEEPAPGCELLVLLPFFITLVASWAAFYDAERALHNAGFVREALNPYWSRRSYVAFHLRQNLVMVFVPILLLIVLKDLPRLLPLDSELSQGVANVLSIVAAVGVFACFPLVVRLVLGLKPLPPGPLRERLALAARRLRFRCNDILIWNTRGGIANAMVVGILPFLRYIVFTDRLISEMTADEIEAVYGHEVGHVKHRHIPYYLVFLFTSLTLVTQFWEIAEPLSFLDLTARKDLAILPLAFVLGAYIILVFGFLSRRCERQADIYGCRAVSCACRDCERHEDEVALAPAGRGLCRTGIQIFIDALEKVATLNGISRDRPGWLQSWQHSTIARRVEFLQRVLVDPAVEPRFQRRVAAVKWVLLLTLVGLIGVFGATWGWNNLLTF